MEGAEERKLEEVSLIGMSMISQEGKMAAIRETSSVSYKNIVFEGEVRERLDTC